MEIFSRFWNLTVQFFYQLGESLSLAMRNFSPLPDLLDIALITYIIYKGIKIVRETRAGQLVKGIVLLGGAYLIVNLLQLRTMSWLLMRVFEMGIFAIIVVFQPELRSALERVGRTKMRGLSIFHSEDNMRQATVWGQPIEVVCEAAQRLSLTATGALIVIERDTKLGDQIRTGVVIDAQPSVELLNNIFFKNSPLHDGAIIMRDGKIYAASCFLPKPKDEESIDKQLGSRHRAALGISEVSDSLTVIVSEETGGISLAINGRLIRNLSIDKLRRILSNNLMPSAKENQKDKKRGFWKGKKNEKNSGNTQN